MKYLLFFLALPAYAAQSDYEACGFVAGWASRAMHIAHKIELPADRWIITEDGYEPDEYAAIMQIKHEAYHDVPALTRRVARACGQKEES